MSILDTMNMHMLKFVTKFTLLLTQLFLYSLLNSHTHQVNVTLRRRTTVAKC